MTTTLPSPVPPVAEIQGAAKEYKSGDTVIQALKPSSLALYPNELVLLIGPSGSGKTTLLSLLGCVIYPTKGDVLIAGESTVRLNENRLAALRLEHIGFVFQGYNLIAPLNALQNVMLPLQLLGHNRSEARQKAVQALEKVHMGNRLGNLPKALSGGQQQRVAIARALVTDPSLILCDEPTAALDPASVGIVMTELQALARQGKCVTIVTHDMRLRPFADRIIYVNNGEISTVPPEDDALH
jgi:putative ABC transport system ATP-binding protein